MSSFSLAAMVDFDVLAGAELEPACAVASGELNAIASPRNAVETRSNNFRVIFPSPSEIGSGINSPLPNGVRYAVDGQHVSGDAVVHVVRLRVAHYIIEGADHDVCELFVHDRLFPEIPLPILHPFEIVSYDASVIAEDAWHDEALHDDAGTLGAEAQLLCRLIAYDHDAAASSFAAAA